MALGFGKTKTADSSDGGVDPKSTSPDDKRVLDTTGNYGAGYDAEAAQKHGDRPMRRISEPIIKPVVGGIGGSGSDSDSTVSVGKQIALEESNAIKYRTCSWPKTAALLFSEYICLAIMSFPWSYSILGLVPGLILTVVIAGLVLYTSLIVWYVFLERFKDYALTGAQGILSSPSRSQGCL